MHREQCCALTVGGVRRKLRFGPKFTVLTVKNEFQGVIFGKNHSDVLRSRKFC